MITIYPTVTFLVALCSAIISFYVMKSYAIRAFDSESDPAISKRSMFVLGLIVSILLYSMMACALSGYDIGKLC